MYLNDKLWIILTWLCIKVPSRYNVDVPGSIHECVIMLCDISIKVRVLDHLSCHDLCVLAAGSTTCCVVIIFLKCNVGRRNDCS